VKPKATRLTRFKRLLGGFLFDGDLIGGTPTRERQHVDVLEPDEMSDDLFRTDVHRGVEDFLFHTLRLKRLCAYAVDLSGSWAAPGRGPSDPANSGRARMRPLSSLAQVRKGR
jgi:hypothetical protein